MSTAPKKERTIRQVMGNQAVLQAIVNHVGKHRGDDKDNYCGSHVNKALKGRTDNKFKDKLTFQAIVDAASKLHIRVTDKQDLDGLKSGVSLGIVMDTKDNDAVYIKNDYTNREDKALTFAFVSKLLHKMDVGPLCDFIYNKKTKQLITFSAQLGYRKGKKFLDGYESESNNLDPAVQAIEKYLRLDDIHESNFGITKKDDNVKPKILDFTVTWKKSNFSILDIEKFTTNLKPYLKGWQENDTLDTYIKRKFAETLDDPKFQKLLTVMPEEQRAKLDEYCKQIVGMDVVGVKLGNHFNNNSSILTNSGIMTFDNIGDNEYGQIGAPSKLSEHFNNQPEGGLNFDNIGDNELVQIGLTSKPKEVKSCLSGCVNSKKNRVDIAR